MTTRARRWWWHRVLGGGLAVVLAAGCGGGGGSDDDDDGPPPPLTEAREFRAIAGVSMGGYGALNLGTRHPDLFGTIASLGGPVDMQQLLRDAVEDNLDVQPQTAIPRAVGADFTWDHLPPYPDRDSRVAMFQDLVIAFGNPFLHHLDPARRYLASDSEPAMLGQDDRFGGFTVPADPRGFLDGGDANEDGLRQLDEIPTIATDVILLAGGSLAQLAPEAVPVLRGQRPLADLNDDGVFDVGDGIVVNLAEPFADANANLVYEPALGETFDDIGLDGVAATGDFGEGNGVFDYDPDRAAWLAQDPLTRVAAQGASALAGQRLYMDVGTEDEFEFAAHYQHLVDVLVANGLQVGVQDGFPSNCADLDDPGLPIRLVRYDAGHIGVEAADADDLFDGDPCGSDTVWQRIVSMIGFLNASFPDGFFGPGAPDFEAPDIDFDDVDVDIDFPDLDPTGNVIMAAIESPALAAGGDVPVRDVLIYVPPAFERTDEHFPIVYFLGGYGQEPEDFERMRVLLDALILTGQLQNMYFAFLPGAGGRQGSFYVNHVVPESQVPDVAQPTSGRYEDSILQDLIPAIENAILDRRIRRQ